MWNQIEQMWEFRHRWKSPGIHLKPIHIHTHTLHLHSLESPQSQPLDNNGAVMSLYCIEITWSFYQVMEREWNHLCLFLKIAFPPLAISSGHMVSTKTQVCTSMCTSTRKHTSMHTPTVCTLGCVYTHTNTQTLCADNNNSLFFFSCLQTDTLSLSSG